MWLLDYIVFFLFRVIFRTRSIFWDLTYVIFNRAKIGRTLRRGRRHTRAPTPAWFSHMGAARSPALQKFMRKQRQNVKLFSPISFVGYALMRFCWLHWAPAHLPCNVRHKKKTRFKYQPDCSSGSIVVSGLMVISVYI